MPELVSQPAQSSPATNSDFVTIASPDLAKLSNARTIGRILATLYGFVPTNSKGLIAGAEGNGPAREQWLKPHWSDVESAVFSERYGRGSFMQKMLPGKLHTNYVQVLVINWALETRAEFPLENETAEATTARNSERAIFQKEILELQDKWRVTYNGAFLKAATDAAAQSGFELVQTERARNLYTDMKDNLPVAQVDVNSIKYTADCHSHVLKRVWQKPIEERLDFFEALFNHDTLASHMEASRHAVGIRQAPHTSRKSCIMIKIFSLFAKRSCDTSLNDIPEPKDIIPV